MDSLGHVNNSVYFTYFEQARIMWLSAIDVSLANQEQGPIVMTASCTFLSPLVYPGDIDIKVLAHSPGRSSFMIDYQVYLVDEETKKVAHGETKIVWVDYQANHSVPLPEFMLEHIR